MKNKDGNLLPNNVGESILAVVGIVLLMIGLFYGYYRFSSNEDSESAKAVADNLEGKINLFLDSESEREVITIQGFNEEWRVHGFDSEDLGRPDECFFESCVCVCPGDSTSCGEKDSACRLLEDLEGIEVHEYSIIFVPQARFPNIFDFRAEPIKLKKNLIELELSKVEKGLKIEKFDNSYFENYEEYKDIFPNQELPREI